MGIKINEKNGLWEAFHSKRHPITRVPYSLRRRNIKTKSEASRIERELVVAVSDKIRAQVLPTWRVAVEEYCHYANREGFTEKTVQNYRVCLAAHTFEMWGNRLVDSITTEDIRSLIRGKESLNATSTQKNILKMVRGVFKYMLDKGYLSRNPVPHMKFRQGDKIKRVLTQNQATMFLDRAFELSNEWYSVWTMALYTGMRTGELFALTWDNVDFERNQILVDSSWNKTDGFKSTKSGDDRLVDIAPTLLPMLRELKLQSSDRIFVLPRIQKWESGYQSEALRQFLIGIGMEPVRFHDLRASWATMLLNKGLEPVKVMAMGGWKDIKTMMIYMRKAGVDIKGSMSCLDLGASKKPEAKVLNFSPRGEL